MFENFRQELKKLAERIDNTFKLLDSLKDQIPINNPGRPATVKVKTLFEKIFKSKMKDRF